MMTYAGKISVLAFSFCGTNFSIVGGGVVKVHEKSFASAAPLFDLVPFGTRAVKTVAIGKRCSASKISVSVPSQRHLPLTSGFSSTGTVSLARACEVTATIGCENV